MHPDDKAAPAASDSVHEPVSTDVGALTRALSEQYDEWRSTILSFRKALAGLERVCDAASSTFESKRTAETVALVERLAGAAERERADASADVTRVEEHKRRLETELQAERKRVKAMEDELESVRQARARAETALEEADRAHQRALGALQSQIDSARGETEAARAEIARLNKAIEAEKARRSRRLHAVQMVRRAVSLTDSDASAPYAADPEPPRASEARQPAADERAAEVFLAPPLKLISSKPGSDAEMESELAAYARQLFEQIQAIYKANVESGEDSTVIVDRLTANLRDAHTVFRRCLESSNAGNSKVFEGQLALWLDAEAQTAFGRHLSIAAYSYASSVRTEAS